MSPSPPPPPPHLLLHYNNIPFLHHQISDPTPPPSSTPFFPPGLEYSLHHTHTIHNKFTLLPQQQQQQQQHIFFNSSMEAWGGAPPPSPSGSTTCEDCGNQRKKDCAHHRCRTCCRNRGFACATHVQSTWVPASRRREKQAAAASTLGTGSSGSRTTATSHGSINDTVSQHCGEGGGEMPGRVRSPAVFKCMRVSGVDEGGEDEYAYQGVVKIGGHVFKGVLYDQGVSDLNLVYGDGGDSMAMMMMDGCGGFGNGLVGGW